jgi:hypothetical protein
MSDELRDDYFTAAAAVVEAARELETVNDELQAAQEAEMEVHYRKRKVEEKLKGALENLKSADTGRKG